MNGRKTENNLRKGALLFNIPVLVAAALIIAGFFIFIPPRAVPRMKKPPSEWSAVIESLCGGSTGEKVANLKKVLLNYDDVNHGDFTAAAALTALFREGDEMNNKRIRRRIIEDLGRGALVPMIKLLERGKPYEKLNAIVVLAHLDEELSYPAITGAASDAAPDIRLNAVRVLQRKKIEIGLHVLYDAVEDEDARVRFYALLGLYEMEGAARSSEFVSGLLPKLARDPDESVRRLSGVVKDALNNPDPRVRDAAKESLEELSTQGPAKPVSR